MPSDTEFAVFEIGMNHPGEISPLALMVRPDIAIVTTVAAAHLEAFDDIDGIAREKASIFNGLTPGGVAVIQADLPISPVLIAAAEHHAQGVLSFGSSAKADYRLRDVQFVQATTLATLTIKVNCRHLNWPHLDVILRKTLWLLLQPAGISACVMR